MYIFIAERYFPIHHSRYCPGLYLQHLLFFEQDMNSVQKGQLAFGLFSFYYKYICFRSMPLRPPIRSSTIKCRSSYIFPRIMCPKYAVFYLLFLHFKTLSFRLHSSQDFRLGYVICSQYFYHFTVTPHRKSSQYACCIDFLST